MASKIPASKTKTKPHGKIKSGDSAKLANSADSAKPTYDLKKSKPTIRFEVQLQAAKSSASSSSASTVSGIFLTLPKKINIKKEKNAEGKSQSGPSKPIGKLMAEGVLNGLPFQNSIETDNKGNNNLKVDKILCELLHLKAGDTVSIEMTKIGDEVETKVPPELKKALSEHSKALSLWNDITSNARRDWIFWIISGKLAETRNIRVEKTCSKLASGMRRVCCFPGIKWLAQGKSLSGQRPAKNRK